MQTEPEWTFEAALASQPPAKAHLTPEQWYVACVAICAAERPDMADHSFRFTMYPPNPEVQACFNARMAPQEAARQLFTVRH